jgi:hypothetical protein
MVQLSGQVAQLLPSQVSCGKVRAAQATPERNNNATHRNTTASLIDRRNDRPPPYGRGADTSDIFNSHGYFFFFFCFAWFRLSSGSFTTTLNETQQQQQHSATPLWHMMIGVSLIMYSTSYYARDCK